MRPELQNLPQPNWFWHGAMILDLLDLYQPKVCVEIGTNRGCSAIATARAIKKWQGHLTCIDVWEHATYGAAVTRAECQRTIEAAGVGEVVTLRQEPSTDAARIWPCLIDYLYVDADHTYDAVTADLEAWWPHLRIGGLIAGDDYEDPYDTQIPQQVTRAWDDFERRHAQTFWRLETPGLVGHAGRPASRLIAGIKQ